MDSIMKFKKKQAYDVFISYRRTSYDTGNLIAEKLRHAGYKVFFDVDTLTAGKFNEQLLDVISNCKDFILVLPQNALDRCSDPQDWVRRETLCAMKHQKNIIPVLLDGFTWPNPMPEGMEELEHFQAITATQHEYFDMAIERLKSYLKSTPQKPIRMWLTKASIALIAFFVVLGIIAGVCYHTAQVAFKSMGTQMASAMEVMHTLSVDNDQLLKECQDYFSALDKSATTEERNDINQAMTKNVKIIEKYSHSLKEKFASPEFKHSDIESFILEHFGLGREDLKAFTLYYESMFESMDESFESVYDYIEDPKTENLKREKILMNLNGFKYQINNFYYGYLGLVSLLPTSARKTHYEMAKKWILFPNGTPLDLPQEEYDQFASNEMFRYHQEIEKYGEHIRQTEKELEEMEEKTKTLEKK